MAKNKKTKKNNTKVSAVQTVNALSKRSGIKTSATNASSGLGSKSTKPVLSITGISKDSSEMNSDLRESVQNDVRLPSDSVDHSLTREPINLGVKNVQQILNCIKDSTLEVKDLILNECNIIYECKICTNLFRSLANFLAHKRIYCKNHFCERMLLFESTHVQFNDDEEDNCDDNDIEEEENPNEPNEDKVPELEKPTTTANQMVSPALSSATIGSTENINPNKDQTIVSQKRKFIENCVQKIEIEKQKQENCSQLELQLTSIKTNPNAVFQSVQTIELNGEYNQNINKINKKQIITELFKDAKKIGNLSESQAIKRQRVEAILPPIDCESDINSNNESAVNDCLDVKCDICDSTFTSTKTLRVHIKTIHSSNRLVYPCPLCSLAFKQLSNATRHLIQIHKRTKTKANSLKEVMKRRAYSTNSSENSSEVEDISEEDIEEEVQTNAKLKNCENKNKVNSRSIEKESLKQTERHAPRINSACVYNCGAVFNWAPAKKSHEKSCRKRLEVENEFNSMPSHETNGSSHSIVLSKKCLSSENLTELGSNQELSILPNPNHTSNMSSNPSTNLILPNSVEEKIKEFADFKSLRCTICPTQDFMNLNQLLQHAVTHIGYSIYKCHGCSYHSIYENDMKYHLMNNHNINEDMIGKHYQTLPNLTQPRLLILPMNSRKSINGSNNTNERETDYESGDKSSKLKIHLRTMGNTSKKCYEIVDK